MQPKKTHAKNEQTENTLINVTMCATNIQHQPNRNKKHMMQVAKTTDIHETHLFNFCLTVQLRVSMPEHLSRLSLGKRQEYTLSHTRTPSTPALTPRGNSESQMILICMCLESGVSGQSSDTRTYSRHPGGPKADLNLAPSR